jgi:hypothetical protein
MQNDNLTFGQMPMSVKVATVATLIYLGILVLSFGYGLFLGFTG